MSCYTRSSCTRICPAMASCPCYKEKHLKNYNKIKSDLKGLKKNKTFIFGQDSLKVSFMSYFDIETNKVVDLSLKKIDLRNYCGSVMITPDQMFICGGVNFQMNNITSQAYLYTISNNSYEKLESMIHYRFNFAISVFDDKVYVTGGRKYGANDVAIINFCEYYDLKTKKWNIMPPMNVKRCSHQSLIYNNKLYVVGGLSEDHRVRQFEEYDFKENKWTLTKMNFMKSVCSFEIYPSGFDEFLVFGGLHDKGYSNFIHLVNLRTKRIKAVGYMVFSRGNFKLFFDKKTQKYHIIGGASSDNVTDSSKYLEVFDLINNKSELKFIDKTQCYSYIAKYNFNRPNIIVKRSLKPVKKQINQK